MKPMSREIMKTNSQEFLEFDDSIMNSDFCIPASGFSFFILTPDF
jgi:hypothetical protein